jgi:hypothetical protein
MLQLNKNKELKFYKKFYKRLIYDIENCIENDIEEVIENIQLILYELEKKINKVRKCR